MRLWRDLGHPKCWVPPRNYMFKWPVVPLSEGQLRDVRPEDILCGGAFRTCNTYRGGGGYDQFPQLCEKMLGIKDASTQFVVQLRGCTLDCPYCYVTREGVWGVPTSFLSSALVAWFGISNAKVFHLMGGAPAMYMKYWPQLISLVRLLPDRVFHSDLMLVEHDYDPDVLRRISGPHCLYAVDIKGLTTQEFERNTRRPFNEDLLYKNLHTLALSPVKFYFTFTNVEPEGRIRFLSYFQDMYGYAPENFVVDLIEYDAIPFVDRVPWGWDGFRTLK